MATWADRWDKCVLTLRKWILVLFVSLWARSVAAGAELKPETIAAWEAYVQSAFTGVEERLLPSHSFLTVDAHRELTAMVRRGLPVVLPVGQNPHKAPGGLIHDWTGTTFIPGADINAVLSTVRDYSHYKDFYHPAVVDSRLLKSEGLKERFSMVLDSKSLVAKTALDGDYESSFVRVDDRRWYSVSKATRLREVENYGTAESRALNGGEASGFIWRLLSIDRFEQRDGGVYVEVEAIALSRDVPASLRWIVNPMVRKLSKSSLVTSLQQTNAAVTARDSLSARSHPAGRYTSAPGSTPFGSITSLR